MNLQDAGNIGNLLSGITIFIVAISYYLNRQNRKSDDYINRVKRTFKHVGRLKEFYTQYYFLYIQQLIDNFINKRPIEELSVMSRLDSKTEFTGNAAREQIRTDMLEVYKFMEETMYLLRKNKEFNLIDVRVIEDYLKRYSKQIKLFFTGQEMLTLIFKSNNIMEEGFGHIDDKDFAELKNYFQTHYSFLK